MINSKSNNILDSHNLKNPKSFFLTATELKIQEKFEKKTTAL